MFEQHDIYENDEVRRLRAEYEMELNNLNVRYSEAIQKERQKEKDSMVTNWKMVWMFVLFFVLLCVALPINHWLFPPTSIFSWTYWHNLINHLFPHLL